MSELSLTDRYTKEKATAFISGVQALARLPIEQLMVDARNGLNNAAFISGYPGSPLGTIGDDFDRAIRNQPSLNIHHQPGLNEEYAATAVMGSQLASTRPDTKYDGVIGFWYGKSPGVDRAADALRHAVYAGAWYKGGAVALVGDDSAAKSSTLPGSSTGILADLHIPLLYPGTPAEALDLGRHAIALSRASGLWSALKIVSDVAQGTASVDLDIDRIQPIIPTIDGKPLNHHPDWYILAPRSLETEKHIVEVRFPLAVEYARLNNLNRITTARSDAWIGIIASGITYAEVRESLARLGLKDLQSISEAGIRLLKLQMPIPFDPTVVLEFAQGLDEIVVVEEKMPNLETLIKETLYNQSQRPRVVGKTDEDGRSLFPAHGVLLADNILAPLRSRLAARLNDRLAPLPPPERPRIPLAVQRTPFFCSGCPHNRSTEVPEGSLVGAGIGCHSMVFYMDQDRVGEFIGITAMGNEGTEWIGMAPFLESDHIFQNLGDGTFFHSGQLAITAAIAAKVNITYKILYNGFIAMTGGQNPQGQLTVASIASNLLNQGAARVIVTTDDMSRHRPDSMPDGVEVWDRSRIIEAQEVLAAIPGVTVLIHDQPCAAESRRLRKSGELPPAKKRIVINERICEGCGDCGDISGCLSVQPVDTPFGRRTRIDQTTCNLDYSCIEGDCPSFMEVTLDPRKKPNTTTKPLGLEGLLKRPLPAPKLRVSQDSLSIRLTGIGGTGVVTVAQILGTAAMADGFVVSGLDQVGMSQKAGPVVSDLRISHDDSMYSNRVGHDQADLVIALDQLVAASPRGLDAVAANTAVVGSTSVTPTGAMIVHPDMKIPTTEELTERIRDAANPEIQIWVDAMAITTAIYGTGQTANIFVLGVAAQSGLLPVNSSKIEEAIKLNGAAVDLNLSAFNLGRWWIADLDAVNELVNDSDYGPVVLPSPLESILNSLSVDEELRERVARFTNDLIGFQNQKLANHYLDLIRTVNNAEASLPNSHNALTSAVADGLYRLTAYKDEYEVARLMLDPSGLRTARQAVPDGTKVKFLLHPPVLRALGFKNKIRFSSKSLIIFRILSKGKILRGTPLDIFGWPNVRRQERKAIKTYERAIKQLVEKLNNENLEQATRIALLADSVRGYENIKMDRLKKFFSTLENELHNYK